MANRRLFIADDTDGFRTLVKKVAEMHDWQVTECENGRRLVEELSSCADPGLIFMDIQMPEMDGIETLRRLSEMSDEREIFIVTGGPSHNASAARLYSEGKGLAIGDVLYKPVSLQRLTEILERA